MSSSFRSNLSQIDIALEKGRIVDIIPKQELTWKISFEIIVLEPAHTHLNIFHFTNNDNHGQHGERTPVLWISNQYLLVAFNTDSNSNYHFYVPISLNKKMSVVMEQVLLSGTTPTIRMFVDQKLVHQHSHNWKTLFENVKVYFSDPWHDLANVEISNFRYVQYNS